MNCIDCGVEFVRTGRNHKRCTVCAKEKTKQHIRNWGFKNGVLTGEGSGSKKGVAASGYRHGLSVFRRWAKERLDQLGYACERCGTIIDASKAGTWAGHHKDHNRSNNAIDNLEVLCKRCHQVEHECWTAFEGVTTIPEGSTQETVEAHPTPQG
jgi:hypothetical protein